MNHPVRCCGEWSTAWPEKSIDIGVDKTQSTTRLTVRLTFWLAIKSRMRLKVTSESMKHLLRKLWDRFHGGDDRAIAQLLIT